MNDRQKPKLSESANQSDADEIDEIWLFQAIDNLAERDNLEGLMRARARLEKAIQEAQLRKLAHKTRGVHKKMAGVVGHIVKAKKALKRGIL